MREVDLAWMAGILDLKGRVQYKANQTRRTRQLVLMVDSAELSVVQRMARLTGTQPDAKMARPVKDWMRSNCLEHCPEPHTHVLSGPYPSGTLPPVSRWTVTGAGMVVVYNNLLPYLTIDRYEEGVREADMFVALDGPGSGMVLQSLRRLRDLGWNLPQRYSLAVDARDVRMAA